MSDTAPKPAGWYDNGKGTKEWWDGSAWASSYSVSATAPTPPATAPVMPPVPVAGATAVAATNPSLDPTMPPAPTTPLAPVQLPPVQQGRMHPGLVTMIIGFGVCALGIVVTIGTYLFAPGGTYFVWWGAMLFGAISGIRGLMTYLRSRR